MLKSPMASRFEWMILEYDSIYHPDAAYHFELHWLAATAGQVDDWIQTARRRSRNLNLKMVQIPVQQSFKNCDPFQITSFIEIDSKSVLEIIQQEFLSVFGFLIDGVSTTGQRQYIHCSCMSLIRVRKDGFFYSTNYLRAAVDLREESIQLFKKLEARVKVLIESEM